MPIRVAGYGEAQIANAAVIASVAVAWGMGERGALLGVMCAMGESSLQNINYGDWETSGVRNPDGTPTTSIGLFQQQASWGSEADRMDPVYASWAFFNRLKNVANWQTIAPTLAIHRVQINADPNHYAKYESAARAVLAEIPDLRAKGIIMADPMDVIEVPWQPGNYARRALVEAVERAGKLRGNSWGRLKDEQQRAWDKYQNGTGSPADDPNRPNTFPLAHVRFVAVDVDATADNVRRLLAQGLVRPYSYEPWHFQLPGSVYKWPLVESIPSTAGSDAKPLPKPPTEEEQIMSVKDEIVSGVAKELEDRKVRSDAIVWVNGSAFLVDDAGGTKWNVARGQKTIEDAFAFINWLRARGFTEYLNQPHYVLAGYRDVTEEGSVRDEVAKALRETPGYGKPADK